LLGSLIITEKQIAIQLVLCKSGDTFFLIDNLAVLDFVRDFHFR